MDKRYLSFIIYHLSFSVALIALALSACSDDHTLPADDSSAQGVEAMVGTPVLFASGNEHMTTRATPYMAQDGRFVCTMYYHAATGATDESPFDVSSPTLGGTMTTAWLKVNDGYGNSVYRKKTFDTPATTDTYDFDTGSTIFYWQNRLTHAFLALADYNKLTTNEGLEEHTITQGQLKMFPYGDKILAQEEEEYVVDSTTNSYDLTRKPVWGEIDVVVGEEDETVKETYLVGYGINSMSEQPDPMLALTIMKPAGFTPEANRVRLYFKHQFSQIQVNIRASADNSADISANQIKSVELLGVSEEGYVTNHMNSNGTVGTFSGTPAQGDMNAASAKEVDLSKYSDVELEDNQWGTSFLMFDMAPLPLVDTDGDGHDDRYALGYLKSFNAIAFGNLEAIRIKWFEGTPATLEHPDSEGIVHTSTYRVPATNAMTEVLDDDDVKDDTEKEVVQLRKLQSGMKYIYNLELRRGTLAVIRTQIVPWEQRSDLVHGVNGTIQN